MLNQTKPNQPNRTDRIEFYAPKYQNIIRSRTQCAFCDIISVVVVVACDNVDCLALYAIAVLQTNVVACSHYFRIIIIVDVVILFYVRLGYIVCDCVCASHSLAFYLLIFFIHRTHRTHKAFGWSSACAQIHRQRIHNVLPSCMQRFVASYASCYSLLSLSLLPSSSSSMIVSTRHGPLCIGMHSYC